MSRITEIRRNASVAYIAPFIAYVALMALERTVDWPALRAYPIRFVVVLGLILTVSRRVISLRPSAPLASLSIGIAVFLIWVGPDVLFGPSYRAHWLFSNPMTGAPVSSIPAAQRADGWFLLRRVISSAVLVPILEELFWRGWLMRWLIDREFLKIPIGTYAPMAFWTVALLFASEHGPFWEVGLVTGVIYNWWCIRTKRLADCILAHAVTNAVLSVYVIFTAHWQYWL